MPRPSSLERRQRQRTPGGSLYERVGLGAPPPGDLLTHVLESVRMRCTMLGPSRFSAPWGVRVPPGPAVFYVVTSGGCVVELDGGQGKAEVAAGDIAVVTRGQGHRIGDLTGAPGAGPAATTGPGPARVAGTGTPLAHLLTADHVRAHRGIIHGGPGAITTLLMGHYWCDDRGESPLLAALPALIHVRGQGGPGMAWQRATAQFIAAQAASDRPGVAALMDRLGQVFFIEAVRAHLAAQAGGQDWLAAAGDPEIGPALAMVHQQPDVPWTVASLADAVGISRSSFAARFAAAVGQPPLSYLHQHRMHRASHWLRAGREGIKAIAARVGYESVAAFSNAFKRWSGMAPGAYRRAARKDAEGKRGG